MNTVIIKNINNLGCDASMGSGRTGAEGNSRIRVNPRQVKIGGNAETCRGCYLLRQDSKSILNVYASANGPGTIGRLSGDNPNPLKAPDMAYNDLDLTALKGIPLPSVYNPANYVEANWDELIDDYTRNGNNMGLEMAMSQRKMADALKNADSGYLFDLFYALVRNYSTGDKQTIATSMVTHFKNNNGADFRNNELTNYAKNHRNTRSYITGFKNCLKEAIKRNNGEVKKYDEDDTFNTAINDLKRPKFNLFGDIFTGLKIMINDTHGMQIHIGKYKYCPMCKKYTGNLAVNLYDHFGLDQNDLVKFYLQHEGFGAWFYLQHYTVFVGRYRPFITRMNFIEDL